MVGYGQVKHHEGRLGLPSIRVSVVIRQLDTNFTKYTPVVLTAAGLYFRFGCCLRQASHRGEITDYRGILPGGDHWGEITGGNHLDPSTFSTSVCQITCRPALHKLYLIIS